MHHSSAFVLCEATVHTTAHRAVGHGDGLGIFRRATRGRWASTIRTVPHLRLGRIVRKPDTCIVKPLDFAVFGFTTDHLAIRHFTAEAIHRFIRIDDVVLSQGSEIQNKWNCGGTCDGSVAFAATLTVAFTRGTRPCIGTAQTSRWSEGVSERVRE